MFAKISGGSGARGLMNYITRAKKEKEALLKKEWRMLKSDGVRIGEEKDWRKKAAADIARPMLMRAKVKNPIMHISLSFSPKDNDRITDEFMTLIADEYMEKMGIKNTPYILVRHVDKDHPHCHMMFSRVDYEGKLLRDCLNFNKSVMVCNDLTTKYGLTRGEDSLSLDTSKLRGAEKSKVEIRQIVNAVMKDKSIMDWNSYITALRQNGIKPMLLYDKNSMEKNVKTIIYKKDNHSFVASKISKGYTLNSLQREFRRRYAQAEQARLSTTPDPNNSWIYLDGSPVPPTEFGGIKITSEQQQMYAKGYTIHVGDAYIKFNPDTKEPMVSSHNIDILEGGGMPFAKGAHPEYEAFFNGLSGFDQEAFKRFRKAHPKLTNQEAMAMFKAYQGNFQRLCQRL